VQGAAARRRPAAHRLRRRRGDLQRRVRTPVRGARPRSLQPQRGGARRDAALRRPVPRRAVGTAPHPERVSLRPVAGAHRTGHRPQRPGAQARDPDPARMGRAGGRGAVPGRPRQGPVPAGLRCRRVLRRLRRQHRVRPPARGRRARAAHLMATGAGADRWRLVATGVLLLALAADTLLIAWQVPPSPARSADVALVLLALLPAIAVLASPPWRDTTAALALAGAGLGASVVVRLFGSDVLHPGHVGWLAGGDLAQHYLGWEFFRRDAWRWPPGANQWLAHPVGTSLLYTDSMPLFGLLLKPFHALLPATFQYLGLVFFSAW